MIGSQDLAASLGHRAEPRHPEVLAAIDTVLDRAKKVGMPVGMALGDRPEIYCEWHAKGVRGLPSARFSAVAASRGGRRAANPSGAAVPPAADSANL